MVHLQEKLKTEYIQLVVNLSSELNYNVLKITEDLRLAIENAENATTYNQIDINAVSINQMIQIYIDNFIKINCNFNERYKLWLRHDYNRNDLHSFGSEKSTIPLVDGPEVEVSSEINSAISEVFVADSNHNDIVVEIDEDIEIVNEVSYFKIQKTTVSNPSSDSSEVVVVAKSKTDEPETDQCPEADPNTEKHDHKYSKAPQTISKECHPADQDEKLLSKCYVLLDNLETLQGNYQNDCSSLCGLVNSNSPVEEFQRLLNLEDLEKKRKRDYSSSDSVESKRSNRAKKVSKKLKNSTSSSSDSDTFSDSSDSSSKSYSDSSNNSFQLEVNEPVNDFHEERLKQNLLSSDDEDNNNDDNDDDDDDGSSDDNLKNDDKDDNPIKTKKNLISSKQNGPLSPDDFSDSYSDDSCDEEKKSNREWLKDSVLCYKINNDDQKKKKNFISVNEEDSEECLLSKNLRKKNNTTVISSDSENESSGFSSSSKDIECVESYREESIDNSDVILVECEPVNTSHGSGNKKSGRRNIREIIADNKITADSKQAAKAEEIRLQRLEKRHQQLSTKKEVKNRFVLDIDLETKKDLVIVDNGLVKRLKPHQKDGVKFMWDACFESIDQVKNTEGSGCILAHCMGLGKTFQVVTLAHTVLVNKNIGITTIMVVCPKNTIYNWIDEFDLWQQSAENKTKIRVYHLTRLKILESWHQKGGVMIISYDLFRTITSENPRIPPETVSELKYYLTNPGADVVVCDEGHLLKMEQSKRSLQMQSIKTKRRIVLTGTPLQNNLNEYHCMVQFVKPSLLGTKNEFMNRFVNPINNGQWCNSTDEDIWLMKKRTHVLYKILEGSIQRRDYAVLTPFLPPKYEYVIHIRLSDVQENMYKYFVEHISFNQKSMLANYHLIQQLVSHPRIFEKSSRNTVQATTFHNNSDNNSNETCDPWWTKLVSQEQLDDYKISCKMIIFFAILKKCEVEGDKVLIFSQSLRTLDLIQEYLQKIDEKQVDDLFEFQGQWKKGCDYYRLDGKTSGTERKKMCEIFNDKKKKRMRLFLISTKAGGLGINLTGANRVIVFDPSWNPSNDVQSIFRVFRFGQTKPCFVYRFLAAGTMEQKIYNRQVNKLSLSLRVLDEQEIARHYRNSELAELYAYEPYPENTLITEMPKDRVLESVIKKFPGYICGFFEHDSLFQNKEDEKLNEDERKNAWIEYKKEADAPTNNDAKKGCNKKRGIPNTGSEVVIDLFDVDPVVPEDVNPNEPGSQNGSNSDTSLENGSTVSENQKSSTTVLKATNL